MALESTQPLTEMSTRNLPGGEGRQARRADGADNLTAICEPRRLTTLTASTACYSPIQALAASMKLSVSVG
jgi:hypothetical protein